MQCRICGNSAGNIPYIAQEMMFGTKEKFEYFQCSSCDCLQISEIPPDISRFYPENYYSYSPEVSGTQSPLWKRAIKQARDRTAVTGKGVFGKLLLSRLPSASLESLAPLELSPNARILDVGCGSGYSLHSLRSIGFSQLTGCDPFLPEDIDHGEGLKIRKCPIEDMYGEFDLVMLHHVIEHLADQAGTLRKIRSLLSRNGKALIRTPCVSSWAWKNYRTNWALMEAPRHLYIHSIKSFKRIAENAGLRVGKTIFDSTPIQFWGSIQIEKGIHLESPQSYGKNPSKAIFSRSQIQEFLAESKRLNRTGQGDSVSYYLSASSD